MMKPLFISLIKNSISFFCFKNDLYIKNKIITRTTCIKLSKKSSEKIGKSLNDMLLLIIVMVFIIVLTAFIAPNIPIGRNQYGLFLIFFIFLSFCLTQKYILFTNYHHLRSSVNN